MKFVIASLCFFISVHSYGSSWFIEKGRQAILLPSSEFETEFKQIISLVHERGLTDSEKEFYFDFLISADKKNISDEARKYLISEAQSLINQKPYLAQFDSSFTSKLNGKSSIDIPTKTNDNEVTQNSESLNPNYSDELTKYPNDQLTTKSSAWYKEPRMLIYTGVGLIGLLALADSLKHKRITFKSSF